jgi:hypothetical protein
MLLQNYLNSRDHLYKWLVVSLLAITTGCAESLDTVDIADEIAQKPAVVKVFSDDYFDENYTEEYLISGFDESGSQYVGTYRIVTGAEEVFNGENAIPVSTTISYSLLDINNVPVTPPYEVELIEYFSSTLPRRYLGSYNTETSLTFNVQGNLIDIPETIFSGTTGTLTNLIGSDSSKENITWAISDNGDDTFDISFIAEHTDSSGALINRETRTFVIDSSGERLYWSLMAEVPLINNTLTFFGTIQ